MHLNEPNLGIQYARATIDGKFSSGIYRHANT